MEIDIIDDLDRNLKFIKTEKCSQIYIEYGFQGAYITLSNEEALKLANTILEKCTEVKDCTTCKHRGASKYVKPCYGCRDNDSYENYEHLI